MSEYILKSVNRQEALRYLGYGNAPADKNTLELMDRCEDILLKSMIPRYVYKLVEIEKIDNEKKIVSFKKCTLKLFGKNIIEHLYGCDRAAVMAATLSVKTDEEIRKAQITSMALSVVLNAMANAAIEQVCDMAQAEIRKKEDGYMTWRFSPGYGDLPLEIQPEILKILDAGRKIGLYATEGFMLTPEKSVTAIIGFSNLPLQKGRESCDDCGMSKSCEYRKKGEHCV